ncbi:hypothetical protein TNCV_3888511 [Trichonephila clavipes]|nr:hypothetical protein TNCV_3888511 [Trichonephila clavipes]
MWDLSMVLLITERTDMSSDCPSRTVELHHGDLESGNELSVERLASAGTCEDVLRLFVVLLLILSSDYDICKSDKKNGIEEVPCPKSVTVNNGVMGGVDRFDQRKARYQIGRRFVKW